MTTNYLTCIGLTSVLLAGGCTGIPKREEPYKQLMTNMRKVEDSLNQLQSPVAVPGTENYKAGRALKLPLIEARFCVQRALDAARRAEHTSGADLSLIILGGTGVTYGMAASAGAAALPEGSNHRQWLLVSGAVSTAAAAGIYALRTALSLSDVAREHRIAAARNVNAALGILMHYAVTDEGLLTDEDDFITCRDSDIAIANAYPGIKAAESSTAKQSEQVAKEKQTAKTAQDAVAEVKATAEKKLAEADEQVKTALAKQQELAAKVATKGIEAQKKLSQDKRSALSVSDVLNLSLGTLAAADKLVEAAKAVEAVDPNGAANLGKEAASTREETKKAEQKKNEAKAAEAAVSVSECEADRATAKADVAAGQLDALRAATRFRRAVLLLTPADVSISGRLLKEAFEDLGKSKKKLEKTTCAAPAKGGPVTP